MSEAFSTRSLADDMEYAGSRRAGSSRIWGAEAVQDVAAVSVTGVRQVEKGSFRSLYTSIPGQHTATMRHGVIEMEAAANPMEEARMEAFTMGFDEGCRITAEANANATDAQDRLTQALEMLAPAPSGMLSTMLSATVVRLVEQIVGEVEIDIERLVQRCDAVAAFIEDNQGKSALHLHPDDISLLDGETIGVRLVADRAMHRGCVRLETADGWVEDGPDVRLARLRALMDDMEGKS